MLEPFPILHSSHKTDNHKSLIYQALVAGFAPITTENLVAAFLPSGKNCARFTCGSWLAHF